VRALKQGGFTLAEVLVVVVLATVVFGAIYRSIGASQQVTQSQIQRLHVQQDTRTVALFLGYMLRELDAADGDVATAAATGIVLRGMRWAGALCADPVAAGSDLQLTLRNDLFAGLRHPIPLVDSLLLFRDGNPASRADDAWLLGHATAASPATCPDGAGATSLTMRVAAGAPLGLGGAVTSGAPVRGFQRDELFLLADTGGVAWLARRTALPSGGWSPDEKLAGPLAANGLVLAYFDSTGAPAATTATITNVQIVVRGRSPQPARLTGGGVGYLRDSAITRVALRNNPGF
jgi:prepilin-type N-terminal cleavage/methylation domain-containing protein